MNSNLILLNRQEFIDKAANKYFDTYICLYGNQVHRTKGDFYSEEVILEILEQPGIKICHTDCGDIRITWESYDNCPEGFSNKHLRVLTPAEPLKDSMGWGCYLKEEEVILSPGCQVIYDNLNGYCLDCFFKDILLDQIPENILDLSEEFSLEDFESWFFFDIYVDYIGDFIAEISCSYEGSSNGETFYYGITNKSADSPEWQMVVEAYCDYVLEESDRD